MNALRWTSLALTFLVALPTHCLLSADEEILTVGSPAPKLSVGHWFPQADGKTRPVTTFEKDKIYVVEFWATYCGPCIQTIPRLAQLQQQYAEKGVQIIGISTEDVPTVTDFLGREVPQRAPTPAPLAAKRFGDFTKQYSLACDKNEATYRSYMLPAWQPGIPTAFIVGRDGKIEWIGSPMFMEEVLRDVVAGTWKREPYGKDILEVQQATKTQTILNAALQAGDFQQAVKLIDARIAVSDNPKEQLELRLTKVQMARAENNSEEAVTRLKDTFAYTNGRIDMIDVVCWHIYEQSMQRRGDWSQLVSLALAEGERALPKAQGAQLGSLLDTVGHLAHKSGDKNKAIKYIIQAIDVNEGESKEFSKQFLKQLKAE